MITSFIYGPMMAGKTTRLLKGYKLSKRYKLPVSIIKPHIDNRAGEKTISTHDGHMLTKDIYVYGKDSFPPEHKCRILYVEEAQFFSIEEIKNIIKQAERNNTSMLTFFGLQKDYAQDDFPSSLYIQEVCHMTDHLMADCAVCGDPADNTQRLLNGKPAPIGPKILVGGSEGYESRCDNCYVHPADVEELF